MSVFLAHPDLLPTTAVGLPEIIFHLDSPWPIMFCLDSPLPEKSMLT